MPHEPLRVLLLIDEMEVGGTQRQIVELARGMDRARFTPTVAYFRNRSHLADELAQASVRVDCIPKNGRIEPRFVRDLVRYVHAGRFHVMHCFSLTAELWGAVAHGCLPRARRPALFTSLRSTHDWYSRSQWMIKRWVSRRSCRVIANSRAGSDYARERMGLAEGAIQVVYNGVATAPEGPVPAGDGALLLQFVGRLVDHKNLPLLLRALRTALDRGVPVRLRIAGDGPLRPACEEMIRSLRLSNRVEMLGERRDATRLIAGSHVVVLPSLREGLSNVILEAMMVGRPVIASAVGGNVELIEPEATGLLFPSGDHDALARQIGRLAAEPGLRLAMGRQARHRALERFSVRAMVDNMQRHYSEFARQTWTA
ncbi:MAG TPA: glycosyltransferase family 4 protein [Usitatibacter sp.]|nr:glycosyltransferase family 4 protein [Usitatibacter sp.]